VNKAVVRKQILKERREIKYSVWQKNSNSISQLLINSSFFENCNSIHSYVSYDNEVDTHQIISHALSDSKKVYTPKVSSAFELTHHKISDLNSLHKSKQGILEPINSSPIMDENPECILIPGLAFDHIGHRLGYGGGYYDRFLEQCNGLKIGLFFEFQKITSTLPESHDVKLNLVITENKIYEF
jgi:5-formyltetrahydrofolate cyclo-ligase